MARIGKNTEMCNPDTYAYMYMSNIKTNASRTNILRNIDMVHYGEIEEVSIVQRDNVVTGSI